MHARVISPPFLCPVFPKDVSALYMIKASWRWVPVRWTACVFRMHRTQLGLPLRSGIGLSCIRAVLNTWSSAWSFVVWCLPFQVAKYWLLSRATRLIVPHALHYFSSHGWGSRERWRASPKFWLGAFGRVICLFTSLNASSLQWLKSCLLCEVLLFSVSFFLWFEFSDTSQNGYTGNAIWNWCVIQVHEL